MKTKELMIGDWVLWGESVYNINGDYDIVWEEKQLSIDDFATMVEEEWSDSTFDEFVKPIPITAEILEKNGFVLKDCSSFHKHFLWTTGGIDNYADVHVTCAQDHNDDWRWNNLKFKLHFCGGDVLLRKMHYVHELQHAMKLCGIEKEIEL